MCCIDLSLNQPVSVYDCSRLKCFLKVGKKRKLKKKILEVFTERKKMTNFAKSHLNKSLILSKGRAGNLCITESGCSGI